MSLGRKAGYLFTAMSLVLVFIAFTTPYWLASDPRVYSAQLLRLGLWETCFRSFADPRDLNMEKYYVGCRLLCGGASFLHHWLHPAAAGLRPAAGHAHLPALGQNAPTAQGRHRPSPRISGLQHDSGDSVWCSW
ncbi:hypothetical protein V5799_020557 [Amblyomma americanum]|uniref:Uncharacterized protein n=1 Tax=Amblyomma americanum TaxID=6943 RepID=A0AAQ4ETR8_AMBAM